MSNILENAYFSQNIQEKSFHYHDCHQIVFITRGTAEFCVNNAKHAVGAGSILIISRFENHSVTVLSKEYERYVLHISANVTGEGSHIFSLLFNRPKGFQNTVDVSENIDGFLHLFQRLTEEYQHPGRLAEDMQKLLLQEMLIMVYRQHPEFVSYDPVAYAVQQKLENNCAGAYTLAALAKEHNLSVSSLSHRFRAATGIPVMEYLLSCRMASAKRMLAVTDTSIGEIVEACGFSDNSNFSRAFKNLNGMSPTDFRKQYKAR